MSSSPSGEKKKIGRPTLYNQEMADLICMRTATSSFGLRKLCNTFDDLPVSETVWQWRYKYPEFNAQYALAKLKQAEFLAEEIMEIADDATNDWMETMDIASGLVIWKLNGEHINRSRLRIESRKWMASKLLPKTYGTNGDEGEKTKDSLIEKLVDKIAAK